jgi:hypothetical protein
VAAPHSIQSNSLHIHWEKDINGSEKGAANLTNEERYSVRFSSIIFYRYLPDLRSCKEDKGPGVAFQSRLPDKHITLAILFYEKWKFRS